MKKKEDTSEVEYLDIQAEAGITKHLGGPKATKKIIELCHIIEGDYVLDVGCGIGVTASLLAKKHGCRVVAVDISKKMIGWAKETAKGEKTEEKIEFAVAGAEGLPFKNNTFDAVICESVLAFVKDKQKAVDEFVRVTKPGGYVGINESTWLKTPPKEVVDYFYRFAYGGFLGYDEWVKVLKKSGLKDIKARTYRVTAFEEFIDRLKLVGLSRVVKAWGRIISKLISDKEFRKSLRKSIPTSKNISEFTDYTGYGIYVGRKR